MHSATSHVRFSGSGSAEIKIPDANCDGRRDLVPLTVIECHSSIQLMRMMKKKTMVLSTMLDVATLILKFGKTILRIVLIWGSYNALYLCSVASSRHKSEIQCISFNIDLSQKPRQVDIKLTIKVGKTIPECFQTKDSDFCSSIKILNF